MGWRHACRAQSVRRRMVPTLDIVRKFLMVGVLGVHAEGRFPVKSRGGIFRAATEGYDIYWTAPQ